MRQAAGRLAGGCVRGADPHRNAPLSQGEGVLLRRPQREGRVLLPLRRGKAGMGVARRACAMLLALATTTAPSLAPAQALAPYDVVDDSIPRPLTATPGDPQRGRAIVTSRQTGLCLLCHAGPFPEAPFQGTLAPDLAGSGARWSEGQLRLRLVEPQRLNPSTLMPTYHRLPAAPRVAPAWQGRPLLDAQQVEDVVALLRDLR